MIDIGMNILSITSSQVAVSWKWVKGHGGVLGNEIADGIASMGEMGRCSATHRRWSTVESHEFLV